MKLLLYTSVYKSLGSKRVVGGKRLNGFINLYDFGGLLDGFMDNGDIQVVTPGALQDGVNRTVEGWNNIC
jgi:hypothetical protein